VKVPAAAAAATAASAAGGSGGAKQSRLATSSGAGDQQQQEEGEEGAEGDGASSTQEQQQQQQPLGQEECLVLLSAALGALGVLSVDGSARAALMAVPGAELLLVNVACLSDPSTSPSTSSNSSDGLRAAWPDACALDKLPPVNHVSDTPRRGDLEV
jgi:hypothetical protein